VVTVGTACKVQIFAPGWPGSGGMTALLGGGTGTPGSIAPDGHGVASARLLL
jgi:hypothetical protein